MEYPRGIFSVMDTNAENTIVAALDLPVYVRALLAEKLLESLDSEPQTELSDEWREEVRKRCREIDEGTVGLREVQDVFDRAYASLK